MKKIILFTVFIVWIYILITGVLHVLFKKILNKYLCINNSNTKNFIVESFSYIIPFAILGGVTVLMILILF